MKNELSLKFSFQASHSLVGYEEPHPHLWRLEVIVGGVPIDGRILDIVELRACIEKQIHPLRMSYLNENSQLSSAVRKSPTCETLSEFFFDELKQIMMNHVVKVNSTIALQSIAVGICSMNGEEMGAVRIFL